MEKLMKGKKGITLIALVITIIVLLILAGVTIATLTGDNGLLTKAGDARNTFEKAGEKERIQMEVAGAYDLTGKLVASQVEENIRNNIKDITNVTATAKEGTEEKFFPVKATYNNGHKYQVDENGQIMMSVNAGDKAPSDSNAVYSSGDYTAIIPAGFTVSATESSIENGLVVTDGSENEWVWIPVSSVDFSAMFGTANDDGWTMSGTDVKTKYKANSAIIAGITRGNPGTTSYYREPDVLNNDSYDKNTTNLSNAGLGANIGEAATKLRDDYKAMIESVRKNGGFYVGRYELGGSVASPKVQYQQTVLTDTNWYNLYKACKDIDSSGVVTAMIWGCQWDQVCKFINTSGDKVSLTNSTSYGNYKNSTVAGHGSKKVTGYSESWKANNIYDLAGNCLEWTQEANYANYRAYRGGSYNSFGGSSPVTSRVSNLSPTDTDIYLSSRPVLYLK